MSAVVLPEYLLVVVHDVRIEACRSAVVPLHAADDDAPIIRTMFDEWRSPNGLPEDVYLDGRLAFREQWLRFAEAVPPASVEGGDEELDARASEELCDLVDLYSEEVPAGGLRLVARIALHM